jgi:hypothetical protein
VFGLCATALVTDVIQLATGYHTPFFLTVCKPNYTLLGTSCESNPYITQDICSGHDTHAILSARCVGCPPLPNTLQWVGGELRPGVAAPRPAGLTWCLL